MPNFLYTFGYVTPEAEKYNRKHGTDDEFSKSIYIEAANEDEALNWGKEISEIYVRWLFGSENYSWKNKGYAHWVEAGHVLEEEKEIKIIHVKFGEYPDLNSFHSE